MKSTGGLVVDIRRDRIGKGDTLAGSSNGGIMLSFRASHKAAAQTSFSVSQEAARSKLCSRKTSRIECGRKPTNVSLCITISEGPTLGDVDELKHLERKKVLRHVHLALCDLRKHQITSIEERSEVLDLDRGYKRSEL